MPAHTYTSTYTHMHTSTHARTSTCTHAHTVTHELKTLRNFEVKCQLVPNHEMAKTYFNIQMSQALRIQFHGHNQGYLCPKKQDYFLNFYFFVNSAQPAVIGFEVWIQLNGMRGVCAACVGSLGASCHVGGV